MRSTFLLVPIAALAALAMASTAQASDSRRHDNAVHRARIPDSGSDVPLRGLRLVTTSARPGEPGYGWSYFSDPASGMAVVISPQGRHYFSLGDGLRPVDTTSFGR